MLSSTSESVHPSTESTLSPTDASGGTWLLGGSGGLFPTHGHDASALIRLVRPVATTSVEKQSTILTSPAEGSATTGNAQHVAVVPYP